jgi:hypothetical protein
MYKRLIVLAALAVGGAGCAAIGGTACTPVASPGGAPTAPPLTADLEKNLHDDAAACATKILSGGNANARPMKATYVDNQAISVGSTVIGNIAHKIELAAAGTDEDGHVWNACMHTYMSNWHDLTLANP